MNIRDVEILWNACHDYATVVEGEFPTLQNVIDAHADGRLEAHDNFDTGWLKITGQNACYIEFDIDN